MIPCAALLMTVGLLAGTSGCSSDELETNFRTPPRDAQAWCYWWWLNGNASKEGITRDFEEMKKQGISGALLFDAGDGGPTVPRGPAFMSAAWRELCRHAVVEADRLGIALGVNLCSGWNAGGPWVKPEHAAKKLVSAQTTAKGPGRLSVTLPKPQAVQGFYRDIAVLAVPAPEALTAGCTLTASSQFESYSPSLAVDGNDETRWISNGNEPGMGPTPEKPEFLEFAFAAPFTAAAIRLSPYQECSPKDVEVQCSDDGKTFRTLKRASLKPNEAQTISFEPTPATHFRAVSCRRIPSRAKKTGTCRCLRSPCCPRTRRPARNPSPAGLWHRNATIDLTQSLDSGRPDSPGMRRRATGASCASAARCTAIRRNGFGSGPGGLEIDVMSAEAMDAHFAETGAKLIADAGPLAGKSLQYFHIDSWELGIPTWTPKMREEFQKRRGYDPLPWLPAMLGQIVDSEEETRRFIQDYRRTAADLTAAHYYGRLESLTVKGGLRGTHPESGGPFSRIGSMRCNASAARPCRWASSGTRITRP
jgi:hypothetical protein